MGKDKNYVSLLYVSIHCESEISKQDLQATKKWW